MDNRTKIQMTNKQLEILEFVQSFIKTKGFAPSLQDIATGLGLRSRSNIHRHIHILEQEGRINMKPHKFRTIRIAPSLDEMLSI